MFNINKKKLVISFVLLIVVIGAFIAGYLGRQVPSENGDRRIVGQDSLDKNIENVVNEGFGNDVDAQEADNAEVDQGQSAKETKQKLVKATMDDLEKMDSEVQRMVEFLDDNDEVNTFEQSKFLAASDSPIRRHAAIFPLAWVGTPASANVLTELLDDENEDVAEDAQRELENYFDKILTEIVLDPESGELVAPHDLNEYFNTCVSGIKEAVSDEKSDILMTKIAAQDEKFAIPVLLEILENGRTSGQKESALRMLDMVTHGDGVTNREEAMLWLLEEEKLLDQPLEEVAEAEENKEYVDLVEEELQDDAQNKVVPANNHRYVPAERN